MIGTFSMQKKFRIDWCWSKLVLEMTTRSFNDTFKTKILTCTRKKITDTANNFSLCLFTFMKTNGRLFHQQKPAWS